jgi:tRNA threonylcarbamoyladenosine biosynthesis protein TsaE
MLEVVTHSPEETQEFGKHCGELAQPGDIFLLIGDLGAGKTCLTQGIAFGLGIKEYALSPTFVIMRQLRGRLSLYHVDLYRLDRLEETEDLGLDDYFYGDGISVVEWAEKALALMPPEYLLIEIEYLADNQRRLRFKPKGQRYENLVQELAKYTGHDSTIS